MKIPQLRVCITEVCDKKCFYCRPEGEGCISVYKQNKLNADNFIYLIGKIVEAGVSEIRFTGGEPMLYKDIYKVIKAVKDMKGVKNVSMVTRSIKLKAQAILLKDAGLDSITISLDSLNKETLKKITKVDLLDKLKEGAKECDKLDIPIKFNTVLMRNVNNNEIEDFISYIGNFKNASWKILDYMILPNQFEDIGKSYYLNLKTILPKFHSLGTELHFDTQTGGLGIPMFTFKMLNGVIVYIKDSTIGNHYGDTCKNCKKYPCQDGIMALRLTSDGKLQRCLYREDNLLLLKENIDNEKTLSSLIIEALKTYEYATFHQNAWKPT